MKWYDRFYTKEEWVKKSTEIESGLYDRIKEIAKNELEASVNKIIDEILSSDQRIQAITEKSSEEIWKMFNQFRKDFDNFSENLDKVQKKLNEASNVIGDTSKRSDIIRNRLHKVEQIQLIEE